MASECKLLNHVKTQAPYAFYVAVWSVLVGTLPSGMGKMSNSICILLGFLAMVFMAFVPAGELLSFRDDTIFIFILRILTMPLNVAFASTAAPLNKTGRFDVFTELYILITKDAYLLKLKENAKEVFETGQTLIPPKEGEDDGVTKITNEMTKHLMDDSAAGDNNLNDEANTSDDANAADEEEVPDTTSAALHESTISAISEVGPEDPLPEELGQKPFGESVMSA
jgi:hypothetical protein